MTDAAIVIQTFTKIDTLGALCKSLLTCDRRDQFDLIFWRDSAIGSRKQAEYEQKAAEVEKQLNAFCRTYADQFHSVSMRGNFVNRGTCKTCQIALDSAFEDHDFVIFSEDDTIFAPDALDWFSAIRRSPAFADDSVWAIAGESIFFDAQTKVPDARLLRAAKLHAVTNRLWEQYTSFSFVPSTCFASTRSKWLQFSATRGQPNGDVDLCERCKAEGKRCIFPVVARVKDVGMLHPDGYSVMIHTAANVSGVKNCYLMTGDIRPDPSAVPELRAFNGDAGQLFSRSTLLNGFSDAVETKTSDTAAFPAPTSIETARKAGLAGDWPTALELWQELKKGGTITAEVDTNIGLCQLKLGRQDAARATIQQVLASHPSDSYALSILGHIREAEKNFAAARDIWAHLSERRDVPDWIHASAASGELRCTNAISRMVH
jgi:tetratricopeptide (TPR) repeat protein